MASPRSQSSLIRARVFVKARLLLIGEDGGEFIARLRWPDKMQSSVRDAAGPRKGLEAQPCLSNLSTFFRPDASGHRARNERRPPCPKSLPILIPFPTAPIFAA